MIVAITGGRDVEPTDAELRCLQRSLFDWGCIVLRLGCNPKGVDAKVLAFMRGLPPSIGGPWVPADQRRWWTIERWVADWENQTARMPGEPSIYKGRPFWPSAGPVRSAAMLDGDGGLVLDVEAEGRRPIASVGSASRLVHWPGNAGTDAAVRAAGKRLIDCEPIADLRHFAR